MMEDRLLSLKWNNHKITFFENLKSLREKSNYTDATLAVEGKFYPVHKLVLSTCSEYFRDIFERTPCKSPVIVLKDVHSQDIEALLDYMYLGDVNVNRNNLASLLKTAECLRIKGLAIPDEDPTKLHKNSTRSHDDAYRENPSPKRRRHNSNTISPRADSPLPSQQKSATALDNPGQRTYIPTQSTPNTCNTEQDEPPELRGFHNFVKIEMDDSEEQEEIFRRENNCEGSTSSDRDPCGDYGSNLSKTKQKPENDGTTSFPGSSLQQFNNSTFNKTNTEQDELPVVKVEMDDAEEQRERFTRENNYEGGASSFCDSLVDYESDLYKTEHKPENYGNTSFPGPSLQQHEGMPIFEFEKSYLMSIGVALKEAPGGNDSHFYIQCKLCNKNIKSDTMRRHVGAHILTENLQYRCGFCGGPNENCENNLIPTNKSKGVQYYKVSSNCCYKILYKKKPDTLSKRNKCTNHLLVCPMCPSFQWKYNLPEHYADCHYEYEIPVELTISSEERSNIKMKCCYMSY